MVGATERVTPELQTSPVYGVRGMTSAYQYPHPKVLPETCSTLFNVNLSKAGTAITAQGYNLYNTVQLLGVEYTTGMLQTQLTTGTWQLIVTPTKIYIDDGTTRTNVTGAVTLNGGNDARTRMVVIRDQIVGNNTVNATWVKGNDFTTPTNAAALAGTLHSKCVDIMVHRGLLLLLGTTESGTTYPTRVRWCDMNKTTFVPDITTWRTNDLYEIYEGGTPIVGGVDNFGYALIFKNDGMYPGRIEYNVGYLEFRLTEDAIIRGFSPLSAQSLIARPEFVFGVAREGAFIIRPDLSFELVTKDIQDQWDALNQGRLQYAVSWVREKDHQIRVLLSSSSNTAGHDRVLVYEWETGAVWIDRLTDKMSFATRVVLTNTELDWFGSTTGYLFKNNVANVYTHNNAAYPWQITMQPNDLGFPGKTKKIINVNTYSRAISGQTSLTLNVVIDQGNKATRSKTLTLNQGYVYDSTYTFNSGLIYPSGNYQYNSFFVNRDAETVSPEWLGNVQADIVGYSVEFSMIE